MSNRPCFAGMFLAAFALLPAPAVAIDGEILITHAKALAGNVTPGDAAGYPVTITIPGRFKLASNLFVAANKIGIQVTSPYVTIDLNDFLLQGSNVAWYGVTGSVDSVTIENGTIADFTFDGVNGTGQDWAVEGVRVVLNGRDGIKCGLRTQIRNSNVSRQGRYGINCSNAMIVGNVVDSNADGGIRMVNGSVIGNIISGNGGTAVVVNVGLIQGNEFSNNVGVGVEVGLGSVHGNSIIANSGLGVSSGSFVGLGNNTLVLNNSGNQQVPTAPPVLPMHPNGCLPACP